MCQRGGEGKTYIPVTTAYGPEVSLSVKAPAKYASWKSRSDDFKNKRGPVISSSAVRVDLACATIGSGGVVRRRCVARVVVVVSIGAQSWWVARVCVIAMLVRACRPRQATTIIVLGGALCGS